MKISIRFFFKVTIAYQVRCEFCTGPCIGDYLRCRICIKTYHFQCLYERGHMNDPSFSLPRLARQDWSCPDCVNIISIHSISYYLKFFIQADLTRLLTEDEMNYLIHVFDQIDVNKGSIEKKNTKSRELIGCFINLDGYIIMDTFLEFCSGGKLIDNFNLFSQNEDLEKKHFYLMDIQQKGAVAWSNFALFYSCKLIAAKNKVKHRSIT